VHTEGGAGAGAGRPPARRRRRRRRPGEPRRGLYLLPHLFTTGNLFFGFYSVVQSAAGAYDRAAWWIVLAGLCDALDGRAARLARTSSRFGAEYDSIADTVSFGVAPAMLAYHAGNLAGLGRVGFVVAFLFTACAGLRLARFNVAPGRYRGRFEGLPSPAAAGMIAATELFVTLLREARVPVVAPEWLVAAGVAALALLMVSSVPYRSFKEVDLRHSYGTLVLVVLALAVVVAQPRIALFAIGLLYVPSGPLELVLRKLGRGAPLEAAAPGEAAPPERPA